MINYTTFDAQLGSQYIDIAKAYLGGCRDDYIFFRSAQYEYVLVIAPDIDFTDHSAVTAVDADIITISSTLGTGNSPTYHVWHNYNDASIEIVDNTLVYASDSYYPHLIEGVEKYAFSLVFLFIVFCFVCLILLCFRNVSNR